VNVVIVGARERTETPEDKKKTEEILTALVAQHGTRLNVISVGCDKGIGKLVRDFCMGNKVRFAEVRVKFEGEEIPRGFFAHMFLARNESLLAVGDEFYIFKGPNSYGIVEEIIPRAQERVGQSRVKIYDPEN
jgi:hypothetical protein